MLNDKIYFYTNREVSANIQRHPWRFTQNLAPDDQWTCGSVDVTGVTREQLVSDSFQPTKAELDLEELVDIVVDAQPNLKLYVHGHDTTFQKAVSEAYRLSVASEHQGALLVFSWPTGSRSRFGVDDLARYYISRDNLVDSAPHLQRLLQALRSEGRPAIQIFMIAYSMGARLAAYAWLGARACASPVDLLVFAAADEDQARFALAISEFLRAPFVVLLASSRDAALLASTWVPGHRNRAGRCSAGLSGTLCYSERIVTIDRSQASSTGSNHNYLFLSEAVATYLRNLFHAAAAGVNAATWQQLPLVSSAQLQECYINNDRLMRCHVHMHHLSDAP
ncbi:hypothetical protein COCOBI_03-1650 [Coccomyxa sp. Obi]|nr:hypothetical protein COCOBI_03-1650 [Coccomyxa sp. Obi]